MSTTRPAARAPSPSRLQAFSRRLALALWLTLPIATVWNFITLTPDALHNGLLFGTAAGIASVAIALVNVMFNGPVWRRLLYGFLLVLSLLVTWGPSRRLVAHYERQASVARTAAPNIYMAPNV